MKRLRATFALSNVNIFCSWCFATMMTLTLPEVAAVGQDNLRCHECNGINNLPPELLRQAAHITPQVDPDNPPGRAQAWDSIVGNIVLKRAMEVAIVGHHTITYVGDPSIAWEQVSIILGARAAIMQRCPCGNYQSPDRPCFCTLEMIEKWRETRKYQEALASDIIIDAVDPKAEEFFAWSEPYTDVLKRVTRVRFAQAFGRASFPSVRGNPSERNGWIVKEREVMGFLSAIKTRLDLGTLALRSVCRVAQSIAELDGCEVVTVVHIAEATGYRTPLLLDY